MKDAAWIRAAVLGLSLYGTAMPGVSAAEHKGGRGKDISRCARLQQVTDHERRGVQLTLSNRCGTPLACRVSWRVACGSDAGESKAETARLASGAAEPFFASASHCEGGWSVSALRWTCDPDRDDAARE